MKSTYITLTFVDFVSSEVHTITKAKGTNHHGVIVPLTFVKSIWIHLEPIYDTYV